MTEQDRDPAMDPRDPRTEPTGAHAGTGARGGTGSEGVGTKSGGPDAERDQSGLGAESTSGQGGWRGSEPAQSEAGTLGFGETGTLGSGGGAASQAGAGRSNWDEQLAGQTGGAQGQDAVLGGESWEGRDRDTGMAGWTADDSGETNRSDDRSDDQPGDRTNDENRSDLTDRGCVRAWSSTWASRLARNRKVQCPSRHFDCRGCAPSFGERGRGMEPRAST